MEHSFTLTTMKPWHQKMNVKHACKCVKSITTSLQCCKLHQENVNPAPSESFLHPVDSWGGAHVVEQTGCQCRAVHEEICFIWWWHISWHGSEATFWVCKKCFIEGSLRNVDKIQTKMKTVEEEKIVVELVENNPTLVAELLSSQNSDHTILWAKKKVESKCSEETWRNTLDFLTFWLDCFWAERYRGPQRAYPCIIYLIGGIEQTCWLCKFVFCSSWWLLGH